MRELPKDLFEALEYCLGFMEAFADQFNEEETAILVKIIWLLEREREARNGHH